MESVYWIVPASGRVYWFIVPVFLVLLCVIAIMGLTAHGSQRSSVQLTDQELRVRGDLYGRAIPVERLHVDLARVIDLRGEPSLQPVSRRFGTGMPGYAAGWFRLRSGEKALVYLTDRTSVVYIPTADGYALLLSLQQAGTMLADLKRRAG
jgi:hypothetical protein